MQNVRSIRLETLKRALVVSRTGIAIKVLGERWPPHGLHGAPRAVLFASREHAPPPMVRLAERRQDSFGC